MWMHANTRFDILILPDFNLSRQTDDAKQLYSPLNNFQLK